MNLQENINRIKEMMGLNLVNESVKNVDGFTVDLENGPKNHQSRPLGNWQSDNAWDLFAPEGTVVKSYTEGIVSSVYNNGKKSGSVYGTQVLIKGDGNYPDIFYTHLKNVKLRKGYTVKVGDEIGEISEWCTDESCTKKHKSPHVHIGLPYGKHLKDLIGNVNSGGSNTGGDFDDNYTDSSTSNFGRNLVKKMLSKVYNP